MIFHRTYRWSNCPMWDVGKLSGTCSATWFASYLAYANLIYNWLADASGTLIEVWKASYPSSLIEGNSHMQATVPRQTNQHDLTWDRPSIQHRNFSSLCLFWVFLRQRNGRAAFCIERDLWRKWDCSQVCATRFMFYSVVGAEIMWRNT